MISAINSALSSLQNATRQVNASAERIANLSETTDLIEEAVKLKLARVQFSASISMIKAQAEADKELVRLLDETV
jgi:hypothetical protein